MNFDMEIVKKIRGTITYDNVKDIEKLYSHINAFNTICKTRGEREINTWWDIATIYKLGVMMGKREERAKAKPSVKENLLDIRESILNETQELIHNKK